MRVAVDGRALASPAGGVRRYVTELWAAMARVVPEVHGIAIGGAPEAAAAAGLEHHPAPPTLPTNLGWSAWTLPRAVAAAGVDLVHAPAYTAPLHGAVPVVLTLHDVVYARRPEWYPSRLGVFRTAFYRRSARRAALVLTDSAFSRDEIMAAYDLDPTRVVVVPLGVSTTFQADPAMSRDLVVLHVGDLHVRRNLPLLVDVVAELRTRPGLAGLRLRLIGRDAGAWPAVVERARARQMTGAVTHESGVDEGALIRAYQQASVLAYPSRYEGFGLPILEAMACGLPVVASRAASMPEVAGDAAILVEPEDTQAWTAAMARVLEGRAGTMAAQGRRHASRFTWDRTAQETAVVFRRAITGRET